MFSLQHGSGELRAAAAGAAVSAFLVWLAMRKDRGSASHATATADHDKDASGATADGTQQCSQGAVVRALLARILDSLKCTPHPRPCVDPWPRVEK